MNITTHRLLGALVAGTDEDLAEFSSRLKLPADSVHDRIGNLEQKGIIRGYEVDHDPATELVEAWAFYKPTGSGRGDPTPLKHKFVRAAYEGPGRFSLMLRLAGPNFDAISNFAKKGPIAAGYKLERLHQITPDNDGAWEVPR